MKRLLKKFAQDEAGQDLIEYALLASVIALGTVAGMLYIKNTINSEFTSIASSISSGT